jgi:hypothetical protein
MGPAHRKNLRIIINYNIEIRIFPDISVNPEDIIGLPLYGLFRSEERGTRG